MSGRGLWIRWSWRDLRRRWMQVAAIALVIALGTGTYAALLSTSAWRKQSNDASFGLLRVHDLRVTLNEGSLAPEGTLAGLARGIPHVDALTGVRERLVIPTQVAAPGGMLVSGEMVGSAGGAGSAVDLVSRSAGRSLTDSDDHAPVVVLDRQFAAQNGLPPQGHLVLSGGVAAQYVGHGQSPEYFMLAGGQGGLPFLSQKSFAVLFTSLHSAQRISGLRQQVNDLVLTVRPDAADVVAAELKQAIADARPPLSARVTTRDDIDAYRVLYEDIEGDRQLWQIVALLVFCGAAFAALNLTSRVVEAQRREIGIGMALGVRTPMLALRPLLFGAQVALAGVVLGVAVGVLLGMPLRQVFTDMLPLPVWHTPFQLGTFAQAAGLGFLLPFAGVVWPVWRAVRVEPVDAIRVGHLAARRTRFAALLRRIALPGGSYRRVPIRNVVRTPRRTVLTTLGIAAAITTLVAMLGFLDTFNATLATSERELMHAAPNRVSVSLRSPQPVNGETVAAVRRLPQVAGVSPGLLVPVAAHTPGRTVDLIIEVLGPNAPWTPTITAGTGSGLVLADKAAADLRVRVGDVVAVEHPQATVGGLRTVTTLVPVAGLHPNPMRVFAYVDGAAARMFGLPGVTNLLNVTPAPGVSTEAVSRALLTVPQVASAQAAQSTIADMRSSLQEFLGILRICAAVTLLLALLIAFNTSSIGMDERAREHATMLAFGLPTRTVLGMAMMEALVIGLLATALGIVGGYLLLSWMAATTIAKTLPDIGLIAALAGGTVLWAFVLGVVTVALAPLLTARRLRRMDVPATLRVVE